MVDSKKSVTEQIDTTLAAKDQKSTTDSKLQAEIKGFKELQQAILDDISRQSSNLSHPQANAKQARDAVDALLQQIKAAIDEENFEKAKEVTDMKGILATQEQSLAQIFKSGKSQAMQASMTITIEELRSDIEKIEAQTRLNQAIYDDLVVEITAKLEQRL